MNDNYIMKDGDLVVMHLLNTIVFINDKKPNVMICSANDSRNNVILAKEDILSISKFKVGASSSYNEIKINNTTIDIGTDWLLLMNQNSLICMYLEAFEKVVEYIRSIKERGEK